jgi:RNA polymerase sigma factor for flagellar operon FliA
LISSGAEQEAGLWERARREGLAIVREALFHFYAPFARGLARKAFRQRGRGDIEPADCDQLAYEALLEALARFDPDHGAPFPAFATPRIQGNIADGIARMTEIRGQLSWRHRMHRDRTRSLAPDRDAFTADQALDALSEMALGLALGFMLEGTGLYADTAMEESGGGLSTPTFTAYDSLAWKELLKLLHGEMVSLDDREQAILQLHYVQGMAFDHIATLLGVSKGRISQLHRAALVRLRKRIGAKGHFRLEQ